MAEWGSPLVFCEWLKRRRRALDLTQDELSRRVGCSVGALRKIEAGDRRPSRQLAALLAGALEIPPEDWPTFIRVARGDLNLERLPPPLPPSAPLPDLSSLVQAQLPASPGPPLTRIPAPATSLIGRETELAALERMFTEQPCRLLTLTGIGGIGKTRLALAFAAQSPALFPGGVFYIPLTSVDSPAKIIPTMADVFGFGFSGPSDPQEQLFNHLSVRLQGRALMILDNLEHLLVPDPASPGSCSLVELVADLLSRLPEVCLLATSRERLNLHGEWTYELHGLSVPPANFVEPLEVYDSAALFIDSARRVRADFQAADEEPALVHICRLVEGVPLAIELAAAWVGLLSCAEIAREIQSNLDFLTTTLRDIPARHRSIRATFDHSWKLLTEEERRALCGLSVFHGGFDRAAAGQVAGASLPLLASLNAKSLVRRLGSGRYDLHEVIRQYAGAHLKAGPHYAEIWERHCAYYLAFLGDRRASLKSAAQPDALRQLTDEIDNLRAAWGWAIRRRKYDRLGQAGRAFGWYFEIAGLYREGIEQLELLVQALKSEPQPNPWDLLLGLAQLHQALLYFRSGDFNSAIRLYEESIALLRPTGDPALLADALIFLGTIMHSNGDFVRARSLVEEGLGFARACGERWFEAFGIFNLGYLASLIGCYAEGYEQIMAGLAIWRALGDPHAIAMGLNFLVPTLIKTGRYEEAKACMQESLALCEESKNRWGMGTAYTFLGLACIAGGEYAAAKTHLLTSLEVFSDYTTGWNLGRSYTYLGDAARLAGDDPEAREYYLEALRLSIEVEAIPIVLDALSGLSFLLERAGRVDTALALCCFIIEHPSAETETKTRAGELREDLKGRLDREQLAAARLLAAGKSLEGIVEIALEAA